MEQEEGASTLTTNNQPKIGGSHLLIPALKPIHSYANSTTRNCVDLSPKTINLEHAI